MRYKLLHNIFQEKKQALIILTKKIRNESKKKI